MNFNMINELIFGSPCMMYEKTEKNIDNGELKGGASWGSIRHSAAAQTLRCTYSKEAASLRFWNGCREGQAHHQSHQDPHDEFTEEFHLVMERGRETRPHRARVGGGLAGSGSPGTAVGINESDHSLPFLSPRPSDLPPHTRREAPPALYSYSCSYEHYRGWDALSDFCELRSCLWVI